MIDTPCGWPEIRAAVLARAGHRCEACGIEELTYVAYVEGEARRVSADRVGRARELGFAPFQVVLLVVSRVDGKLAGPVAVSLEDLGLICTACCKKSVVAGIRAVLPRRFVASRVLEQGSLG